MALGTVGIPGGADASGVTAKAEYVLEGYHFIDSSGELAEGSIPFAGTIDVWPHAEDIRLDITGKYVDGDVTVHGDANLAAENIRSGVSIFGVEGTYQSGITYKEYTLADVTVEDGYVIRIPGVHLSCLFGEVAVDYSSEFAPDVTSLSGQIIGVTSDFVKGSENHYYSEFFWRTPYESILGNTESYMPALMDVVGEDTVISFLTSVTGFTKFDVIGFIME